MNSPLVAKWGAGSAGRRRSVQTSGRAASPTSTCSWSSGATRSHTSCRPGRLASCTSRPAPPHPPLSLNCGSASPGWSGSRASRPGATPWRGGAPGGPADRPVHRQRGRPDRWRGSVAGGGPRAANGGRRKPDRTHRPHPMVRLDRTGRHLAMPPSWPSSSTSIPGGSVKDRPALAMIQAAEAEGLLRRGSTIVEPTSGNTGVGLAMIAAQRGYNCIFTMPDKIAEEKRQLLRAFGAKVVVCPTAVDPDHPDSYYSVANRITAETPGPSSPTSTAMRPIPQPTSCRPGRRSGARPRAGSPTSWPEWARAARSAVSVATSRPRTRPSR